MIEYHIRLKSGESIEVPPGAEVVDYGFSLAIERPHVCSCGNHHSQILRSWKRDEMDPQSSVSASGLSMRI